MNCFGSFSAFQKPVFYSFSFKLRFAFSRVIRTEKFQITSAFGRLARVRQYQAKTRVVASPRSLQSYFQHINNNTQPSASSQRLNFYLLKCKEKSAII